MESLHWTNIGGRIPWNVAATCEMFRTDCLMEKLHTKGDLVNHFKDPISTKDHSRIHQFGKRVLPGIFLGYVYNAGGIWKGDIQVVDLEELEEMDASGILAKRLNAKEVTLPKSCENCKFPVADGTVQPYDGDQDLRTSTLIRHRPIQGESNIDFLGESEGSLPPPHDSYPNAGEAINDFWSMSGSFIYRHHVEPRVKLYSPRGIISSSTETH